LSRPQLRSIHDRPRTFGISELPYPITQFGQSGMGTRLTFEFQDVVSRASVIPRYPDQARLPHHDSPLRPGVVAKKLFDVLDGQRSGPPILGHQLFIQCIFWPVGETSTPNELGSESVRTVPGWLRSLANDFSTNVCVESDSEAMSY